MFITGPGDVPSSVKAMKGFANKQTAGALGTSEITVGVHRGQIMRKMGARSLAELVRWPTSSVSVLTRAPE